MPSYRTLAPSDLPPVDPRTSFANDVLVGLSERPKRLPSAYFYDEEGSRLFQRIMGLPEYYLTRCEREVLASHSQEIGRQLGSEEINVVDLGAGDGAKTAILLERLMRSGSTVRYVPIDISEEALRQVTDRMCSEFPGLEISGLVTTYATGLRWLAEHGGPAANLVCFLGSNIGNFAKPRARAFLQGMWRVLRSQDALLIGFDLKKDIDVLLAAYNDPQGVTAAFNLNLLRRMNVELGADFDASKFRHFGTYDVHSGAMVSYLVSLVQQRVTIASLRMAFDFAPWEPVHTEYSYKYVPTDIEDLARDSGFRIEADYADGRGWFLDSLWRPERRPVVSAQPAGGTSAASGT